MSTSPLTDVETIDPAPRPYCWPRAMVTGHRPQHFEPAQAAWAQTALARVVWRLRSHYGTRRAISGLALGADTWWALAALAAGMELDAYIPFEAQPNKWPAADRALWAEIRSRASAEVVVGGQDYDVRMLHARNDAMLNACDLVVAVYIDGTTGGTASAVKKARIRALPLLILDPVQRTVVREGW